LVLVPAHLKIFRSPQEIAAAVSRIATELTPWVKDCHLTSGVQPLAVCVLRGGAPFFIDLLRAIPESIEPTYCRTWSYSFDQNAQRGGGVRVAVDDVVAEGRSILLVDDICDTGATLLKLHKVFEELGAKEVKTAVLVHRLQSEQRYTPNYRAFAHSGPEWFVGYGMEDRNHWANLPALYTMNPAN
jgi:hypoxanthine phosphoribosyltransferase